MLVKQLIVLIVVCLSNIGWSIDGGWDNGGSTIPISGDGSSYVNAKKIIFDGATITDNGNGVYMVSFGTVTPSYLQLEDGAYLLTEAGDKIIL